MTEQSAISVESSDTTYPAWQAAIRKAQEAQAQKRADEVLKRQTEEKQANIEYANKMRELLRGVDLAMPEALQTPRWEIDGYTFMYEHHDPYYSDAHRSPEKHIVYIWKDVPNFDPEIEDEDYHDKVAEALTWESAHWGNVPTSADVADALDKLDQKVISQQEKNERVAERLIERANTQPEAPTKPKLFIIPEEEVFLLAVRALILEVSKKPFLAHLV